MFINAEPRYVSNGFETFVPIHRAEVLRQRLVDMTSNNVNAWSIFRPEAAAENWVHNLDEYSNNENFHVQGLYEEYFQDSSFAAQNQAVNFPKSETYAPAHQIQCQSSKNVSNFQQIYQAPDMTCYQRPSPMLGNDYSQLSLGRGRGSFAEFSSVRNALKDSSYQLQPETTDTSYIPLSSSAASVPQLFYAEEAPIMREPMSMASTSPNTVYSSDSPPQMSVGHHRSSRSAETQHHNFPGTDSQCWQGNFPSSGESQVAYGVPISNDELPKYTPQTFCNPWSVDTASASNWSSYSVAPNTISPKMLRLNVSNASLSSSDSGSRSVMGVFDSSAAISLPNDLGECSSPEAPPVVEPQHPVSRPRHTLPDSIPLSRRIVPIVPSNDYDSSRNSKKRPMKVSKPTNNNRRKSSPHVRSTATAVPSPSPQKVGSRSSGLSQAPTKTKRTEPKPVEQATLSQSAAAALATHHRDAKDEFLIRSKMAGMSYKDIRRQGKFTETESTLRGRFRTLTKHKTARVRRPEWSEKDIRLLEKAVRELSQNLDTSKTKIPWKLVAEYIADHGGSYHFGYATCRKRWDELQNEDTEDE
ncbi:hypothetical protein BUE80_DR004648 [Diplocarpon rosae]|nr:hypothetical protein BUE80_DR004648 [Diplocarpon rosae]